MKTLVSYLYTTSVAQHMLNDVLRNLRGTQNRYSICVWPLCVLENGEVSEYICDGKTY